MNSSSFDTRRKVSDHNGAKQHVVSFLDLPAEIRNKIYKLSMRPRNFDIRWLTPHRDLTYCGVSTWKRYPHQNSISDVQRWRAATVTHRMKSGGPSLDATTISHRRRQFDLIRRSDLPGAVQYELSPGPAALLLVSRQIHQETCPILYGNSSFGFSSRKLLDKFLSSINPIAKASIRSLYLQHETYGEPYEMECRRWKHLHDNRWEEACRKAADCLTSLESLSVMLLLHDRPLDLNLKAAWAAPLLAFRDRGLKKVAVVLVGGDEKLMRSCAGVVRRELLGSAYNEDEETKMEKQRIAQLPKAIRCVVMRH